VGTEFHKLDVSEILHISDDMQGHSKCGRSTGSLKMSHPNLTNCSPFSFQWRKEKKHGLVEDYHVCVNPPFKFFNWLTDFYAILYEYYGDGGHAHLVFLNFRQLVVTTCRKTNYEATASQTSLHIGCKPM
jgi:hypothetical protein